jgi:hypothetical protein
MIPAIIHLHAVRMLHVALHGFVAAWRVGGFTVMVIRASAILILLFIACQSG